MDDKWQMETDARLNAIQSQLASTRKIAVTLALIVVVLGAWVVYGSVSKPKKIVLEDRGSSLTLEPDQVRLKVGNATVSMQIDGIWVRDDGKDKTYTNISPGMMHVATNNGAMVSITALDDDASIEMISHNGGQAALIAGKVHSEMRVTSLHDKGVTIEATPEQANLNGIGKTFFGLGDTALAAQHDNPAPPPAPPPAPAPGPTKR